LELSRTSALLMMDDEAEYARCGKYRRVNRN